DCSNAIMITRCRMSSGTRFQTRPRFDGLSSKLQTHQIGTGHTSDRISMPSSRASAAVAGPADAIARRADDLKLLKMREGSCLVSPIPTGVFEQPQFERLLGDNFP